MNPYPSLIPLKGISCTRMSALDILGKMTYITWPWDRIWRWKEKMKELKMEVINMPFLIDQHNPIINHMHASIYH